MLQGWPFGADTVEDSTIPSGLLEHCNRLTCGCTPPGGMQAHLTWGMGTLNTDICSEARWSASLNVADSTTLHCVVGPPPPTKENDTVRASNRGSLSEGTTSPASMPFGDRFQSIPSLSMHPIQIKDSFLPSLFRIQIVRSSRCIHLLQLLMFNMLTVQGLIGMWESIACLCYDCSREM